MNPTFPPPDLERLSVETAADFFRRRAGEARLEGLAALLARAPDREPDPGDEPPGSSSD